MGVCGRRTDVPPKASYCSGKEKNPVKEMKDLVKALHKAGLELVMDSVLFRLEEPAYALDVVRYWAREYHVDGFHLIGYAPNDLLARDPYLSRVKLWADHWDNLLGQAKENIWQNITTDLRLICAAC